MSYTENQEGSSRADQRFIAVAVTETGVTLRGESEWCPSHWDREKVRREAESNLRQQLKGANKLNVAVGAIRIYRETRRVERVTRVWTKQEFYAEVAR